MNNKETLFFILIFISTYSASIFSQSIKTTHHPTGIKIKRDLDVSLKDGKLWCTSCHDKHFNITKRPGSVPKLFTDLSKKNYLKKSGNELCLTCHTKKGRKENNHIDLSNSGCSSCHKMHFGSGKLLKYNDNRLCTNCHEDKINSIHKTKMIILGSKKELDISFNRGKLICISCHDPHRKRSKKFISIKESTLKRICARCHGNKDSLRLFKNYHYLISQKRD